MPPLTTRRNGDGGFGPVVGAPSEPGSTAMVALAFEDAAAQQWLQRAQATDGSIVLRAGSVIRDETPLGALALEPGPGRERALDHVVGYQGANGEDPLVNAFGWPWTDDTHGWTEPTAWGLLALRTLRPSATDRIGDAIALFEERECVGGGWNYGTREIFGVDIPPFVQTTAVALLGLGDLAPSLSARGLAWLERGWRGESAGTLTLATAACALDSGGSDQAAAALHALSERSRAAVDTVADCWVQMAATKSGPWSAG